jgi:hypothetical protein
VVSTDLLVRIAKDWESPDLLRQTPGRMGTWDGIRFTLEPVDECDFVVVLNNRLRAPVSARCPPENVWAVMQEPYIPGLYDWMVEGHEPYARVFTHHVPAPGPKYSASHPALPWLVERSYDDLTSAVVPPKLRRASWVTSTLTFLPGHRKRVALLRYLARQRSLPVDLFGRGIRFLPDKWDGLAPYRVALAVENTAGPDYWTEKVADCFLSWTVPLYHGCTNLESYFPAEAFVRIDVDRHEEVAETIRELVSGDEWERRLPALEEARSRVLRAYQTFPFLAQLIRAVPTAPGVRHQVEVPAYGGARWRHRARYLADKLRRGQVGELWRVAVNKGKYVWWGLG